MKLSKLHKTIYTLFSLITDTLKPTATGPSTYRTF